IFDRKLDRELRAFLALVLDFVLELAGDPTSLDDDGLDVVRLQLGVVLRVDDLRRGVVSRAGKLNEDDRDQDDQDPKRQCLGNAAPAHFLFVIVAVVRRSRQYWHAYKLAI